MFPAQTIIKSSLVGEESSGTVVDYIILVSCMELATSQEKAGYTLVQDIFRLSMNLILPVVVMKCPVAH